VGSIGDEAGIMHKCPREYFSFPFFARDRRRIEMYETPNYRAIIALKVTIDCCLRSYIRFFQSSSFKK